MGSSGENKAATDTALFQLRFRELRQRPGGVDADPSGWRDTESAAEALVPTVDFKAGDLAQYHVDAVRGLASYGIPIVGLVNAWEAADLTPQRVSLCPSGTSASLAILLTLRDLGVSSVVFETPLYFASLHQARSLALLTSVVPTFRSSRYSLPHSQLPLAADGTAFWLTQPRAGLGFDQTPDELRQLLRSLRGQNQFVVIDEVTEQRYPAVLREFSGPEWEDRLIRIKSFTKGMGLNGIRLAAIIHPTYLKAAFVRTLDTFGGSVDIYSLATVAKLADTPERFQRMLAATNRQVSELRNRVERLAAGSVVAVNRLVNGYIGSIVVDLSSLGSDQRSRRRRFLQRCLELRTPVVLGDSYCIPPDPPYEFVRINYLIAPASVLRGVANILKIVRAPREDLSKPSES